MDYQKTVVKKHAKVQNSKKTPETKYWKRFKVSLGYKHKYKLGSNLYCRYSHLLLSKNMPVLLPSTFHLLHLMILLSHLLLVYRSIHPKHINLKRQSLDSKILLIQEVSDMTASCLLPVMLLVLCRCLMSVLVRF